MATQPPGLTLDAPLTSWSDAGMAVSRAGDLARLFKVFASDSRLRLLELLVRERELCVQDLAGGLTMTPQAVSNQLQRLVDRGIVAPRRDGNRVFYRVTDPCVAPLLELGTCLVETGRADRNPRSTQERDVS